MAASSADNPYVDAQGRTDAETYLMGCLDGSVVAGRRIKQLAEKMLPRIHDGYKQWRFDVDAATRPVEFIERFLKIPSGKLGVPFVLEPYERMIVELTFGFVDENEKRQIQYTLVEVARKNGKALSLDTEIPTPNGWKLMRDIHEGDYVFGQDGKPSKVLVESEVFDKPMYLVTFEDGATIKASADHIWTVRRDSSEPWQDITTETLADTLGTRLYYVPACEPVRYGEKEYDVPPYVYAVEHWDERIPDEYLQGSVMQRTAYLCGLFETCGSEMSWWDTASLHFNELTAVESCMELLASSGYTHNKLREHCGSWNYIVEYWPAVTGNVKWITGAKRISNEPSKCIAIDNDSHLYLAGRQYTATHNTSLAAAIELFMLLADGEGAAQIYNAATSKAQASLAYGAVWRMARQSPKLMKYLRKGTVVERAENGIICDGNMSYVVPLSKQSDHLDGLDVHMCVFDEMAAAEDRSIFDLIRQGTGAREQPLMIAITTQGFVRDNLWDHEREYAIKWLEGKIEDDCFPRHPVRAG